MLKNSFKFYLFFLYLTALGLVALHGLSLIAVLRLLLAAASLIAEHRLWTLRLH